MIKKAGFLLLFLILLSVIIAFLWSIQTKELNLQVEFNKEISILPSVSSFLQSTMQSQKNLNHIIEIEGLYSVEYDAPFAMLTNDEPMTLKNLHGIEVNEIFSGTINETDVMNAGNYETSEIKLLPLEDNGLFEFFIDNQVKISSDKHDGTIFLFDKAIPNAFKGQPSIALSDINFTSSVHYNANLIPSDNTSKKVIFAPLNDFKVILNDGRNKQTSRVFKGMWRKEDYNLIYGRPWLTDLSAQSNYSILSGLGIPSTVTIDGESLSSATFLGFHGWYKIDDDKVVNENGVYDWEIKDVESAKIILDTKSQETSKVLVKVQFQGKASDLIINNKSLLKSEHNFIKNLFYIWSNSIFQGILISLLSIIAGAWLERKVSRGN